MMRTGRAIANSTSAWPGLESLLLATELQLPNDQAGKLGRAARDLGGGITLQNQAARQRRVLGPRVIETDAHGHLVAEDRLDRVPVQRRSRDRVVADQNAVESMLGHK